MDLQKLFTDYWSQITILLLAMSYFIKRIFDNKSKKIEINHSLFQQNKINAINAYFKNYTRSEVMWQQLQVGNFLSKKISPDEVDNIIWPPLKDLRQSTLELQIYFEDDIHKLFSEIFDNLLSINTELSNIYFEPNPEDNMTKKLNQFGLFKENVIKQNKARLKSLAKIIRASFGQRR